jgi:membrane protease subunit HflC
MKSPFWIAVIVAVVLGLLGSVYVVREDQTAMVLNLGKVVRSDIKPGLHFKVPVVETVKRVRPPLPRCWTPPRRYFTEQKDVSVDFFAIGYILRRA